MNFSSAVTQTDNRHAMVSQPCTIQLANQAYNARCNAFVESCDMASVYHLTDWCALIQEVFGHRCEYYMALSQEDEVLGVLPVVRLKSRLFGDFKVSMPYFNYGGAVAKNDDIEALLMDSVIRTSENTSVQHVEFRDTKPRNNLTTVRTDKVAMLLTLPESEEILWKDLGPKRRAQIKRPLREGVEVRHGGSELLNDFYRVFANNMRDLGTPVYSKHFFSAILRYFPSYTHIIVVYHRGNPVGCAFLLGFRGRLEIPWASTLREVNTMGINMFMYWEVLKYAIQQGYKTFDFGRSSVDSGTYRFKKQWGAEPQQLYWHYWLNQGQSIPGLTPSNPKYKLAIKLWQQLPLFVANTVGPFIVKNLP